MDDIPWKDVTRETKLGLFDKHIDKIINIKLH
jgi:hypothetical protein